MRGLGVLALCLLVCSIREAHQKVFTAFGRSEGAATAHTDVDTSSLHLLSGETIRIQQQGTDGAQRAGGSQNAFCRWLAAMYPPVAALPVHPANPADAKGVLVIIEPRRNALLEFTIKHTMHLLGKDWALQIFHSKHNEAMIKSILNWDTDPLSRAAVLVELDSLGLQDAHLNFKVRHLVQLEVTDVGLGLMACEHFLVVHPEAVLLRSAEKW